ncbi:5-formyltetrahydrofolate cyclo-ligase [Candidatus Liberibacter americanus]|uniref:5-formyltetrahydrofolate cyclo-ligase n=1 Tax=Candidatus Liberibacter americanus str. Sao Paulo TaxID=1261131 RepID=U6B2X0_9HYPH|nr:5-formyltetrahydrofolate cyclo-ligase [Candidatus Liberibacter americanus]AHA27409.1 5-formyltetrahydrofolate cyclo-ligase [Candidatus Liberibacter americanus str. Sao Paulo]EMS36682.1 5-formyltetrahydrofolate cyclo-ligase [Candidatus Liberibacter americanus PW_SP]
MNRREKKHLLRKQKSVLRDLLSLKYRHSKSVALAILGEKKISIKPGMKIATFYPIKSEVNVNILVQKLKKKRCSFCMPSFKEDKMIFRQYTNKKNLVKSRFNILSPTINSPEIDPDIILIPLIAFDSVGNRIGYGKGNYDFAIANARLKGNNPYIVGIAFDIQETSYIQAEPNDIRMHAILTESRFCQFNNNI